MVNECNIDSSPSLIFEEFGRLCEASDCLRVEVASVRDDLAALVSAQVVGSERLESAVRALGSVDTHLYFSGCGLRQARTCVEGVVGDVMRDA